MQIASRWKRPTVEHGWSLTKLAGAFREGRFVKAVHLTIWSNLDTTWIQQLNQPGLPAA